MLKRLNREPATEYAARAAVLKIGEKYVTEQGKTSTRPLGYFELDTQNKALLDAFKRKFGEKPTEVTIFFLSNNDKANLDYVYECRNKGNGKRIWWGDGETFNVYNHDKQCYEPQIAPEDEEEYAKFSERLEEMGNVKECLSIRFAFVGLDIPNISLVELTTRGELTSIKAIRSAYKTFRETMGNRSIVGWPFSLTQQKQSSNAPHKYARNYPVLSLSPALEKMNEVLALRSFMQNAESILDAASDWQLAPATAHKQLAAPTAPEPETEEFFADAELVEEPFVVDEVNFNTYGNAVKSVEMVTRLDEFNDAIKQLRALYKNVKKDLQPEVLKLVTKLKNRAPEFGFVCDEKTGMFGKKGETNG